MTALAPHILIVDDDQTFARTLARILAENGYETGTLTSGDGLFEYLATRAVDLLVLDLSLPGRDGFTLLEALKRDHSTATVPILVVTSMAPEESLVKALSLGAADVVVKPFRVPELLARIRTHLRAGRELNEARSEARSQAALIEILREITTNLAPRELFQVLVRRVAAILRIPRSSIILAKPGAERGTVVAASDNPMLLDLPIELAKYPEIGRALETGKVVLVRDVQSDPFYSRVRELWRNEGQDVPTTSVLVLPFALRGEMAGVFFLRTVEGDPPLGDADLRFASQVAESAVSAIEKAFDLEEAMRREAAMRQLVETDPLTGLFNRRALDDKLRQEMDRATRYGTVLTCVMIDLDHFKALNDMHGHPVGDKVLTQFAELLRREQRSVDVVARYGGEEFVVLLPETGPSGARLFAERVLRRVAATPFGESGNAVSLTISIGLATHPDERASGGEALLRLADRNLLRAKADGRNRYRD
ncbi:MAG: diguanylate cyclase [Gemmatimonadales bacterium]